jgi:anti-anti-sigma factor
MGWKIKEIEDASKAIVEIEGVVDSTNVEEFFTFVSSLCKRGPRRIVLDLENTSYLSSAGLSVILDTYKKVQKDGGKLVIARASDMVSDLFSVVQFEKIIEFYDDLQEAVDAV